MKNFEQNNVVTIGKTSKTHRVVNSKGTRLLEEMKKLKESKHSTEEIAQKLGICVGTVRRHIGGHAGSPNTKGARLEDDMRTMRGLGYTNEEIGRRLGMGRVTVYKHLGKQPAWITESSIAIGAQKRKLNAERRRAALLIRAEAQKVEAPYQPKQKAKKDAVKTALQELSERMAEVAKMVA